MNTRLSNKKQIVLLLITRLDRGGSAEVTLQLARGLIEKGFDVKLISGKTTEPPFDTLEFASQNKFKLLFINSLVRQLNPLLDLLAFVQIIKAINKLHPDILHTNSSKAGVLGRFAGIMAGVPKIVHSPHGHIFYGYYNRFVSKIFILLEMVAAHYTDKILNLTEYGKQDHIKERIAPPSKFVVSSCGVDLELFQNARSDNISKKNKEDITICWAGRIVPIKNLILLLKAAALLKKENLPIKYQIIGDGEQMNSIQETVKELKLENVNFTGYSTDLPRIFSQCDIFVLTSLNEGFGRVIVEAMASGLPVISTKVGGVPEIIEDGVNGILVAPNDHYAFANAIKTLGKNKSIQQTMAINNAKKAEIYSINNYINRVIEIYGRK